MRNAHYRTCNMARNTETLEKLEMLTVGLVYGKKTENH